MKKSELKSVPTAARPRLEAEFDEAPYLERTRRNHFWIGGVENQMRLKNLTIGVAGLGGMGSHIAEHLVRLGVGRIKIADLDIIERTNLNRQAIAHLSTIGKTKLLASMTELRGIATDVEIIGFSEGITESSVAEFVDGCDVIVDEIDVFPLEAHVLLHREANKRTLPIYTSLAVGMGIHFYKFQGSLYTFEDFLAAPPETYRRPSLPYLVQLFVDPAPEYLSETAANGLLQEAARSGVPIFGPATLIGHSIVVTRIVADLFGDSIRQNWGIGMELRRTPIMPQFIALDLGDFSFQVTKVHAKLRSA